VTSMPEKKRTELRLKSLGYVFQEFALIPELTALENVMLPAMMIAKNSACRSKALEMLAMVGLEGKEQHLPAQLSGGEQQRVAIARSMVNDPVVLLADEPTANLDSVSAKEILSIFRKLNREFRRTITMVTHEQEETSYGNRVIRLADGVVVDEIRT
jgi:putative ABC transport system ATP-binding protein